MTEKDLLTVGGNPTPGGAIPHAAAVMAPVPPAPPTVTVKLDYGTHRAGEQAALDAEATLHARTNWWHLRRSFGAFALAFICLVGGDANDWLVARFGAIVPFDGLLWGAWVAILLIDAYLVVMLWVVVQKCRTTNIPRPVDVPDRGTAFLMLAFLLLALVMAFATVHHAAGFEGSDTPWQSFVTSFVTAMTLDHGQYLTGTHETPLTDWGRFAIAFEVVSALLFLLVFFPLLVSRLAMFSSDSAQTASPTPRLHLSSNTKMSWEICHASDEPEKHQGSSVEVTVTNTRSIEVRLFDPEGRQIGGHGHTPDGPVGHDGEGA